MIPEYCAILFETKTHNVIEVFVFPSMEKAEKFVWEYFNGPNKSNEVHFEFYPISYN